MSLLPPSVVLPFHARYLEQQLSFGIRNANEEKQGAEASDNVRLVSSFYLTMGVLSYLLLLGE